MTLQCLGERVCKLEKANRTEDLVASAPSMNYLRVASSVAEGETVTIDNKTWEVDTDGVVTSGNLKIDLSGSASVRATQTLTSTGVQVTDGDTVTIGSTVYRLKATLAQAYDVKLITDAATSLANLKKAINATGVAGTDYFAGTLIHPTVTAGTLTATTLVVTAKAIGTAGNAIATTETAATLSWGNTTLLGGTNATAAEFTTAFSTVVSQGTGLIGSRPDANSVIVSDALQRTLATTETLAGANNAWSTANFAGASTPAIREATVVARVPSAQEITVQIMVFPLNFAPTSADVTVRTSAGVYRAWDGAITISGQNVIVASSGSVDVAAADIVTVTAA